MAGEILFLFLGLLMILFASEGFTNGLETLGKKYRLSQAVVGSFLAAVGTALPETILPIVAILFYGGKSAEDIGVGAILGAPFMLSTLAFFLVGVTVTVAHFGNKRAFEINIETHTARRDLFFFLPMYSCAVLAPLVAGKSVSLPIAIILVIGYIFYAFGTFRHESAEIEHSEEMYFHRLFKRIRPGRAAGPHLVLIIFQVLGSLAIMIAGAHTFVASLERVSARLGLDPLLFALLLAPVATELPEKINSVTWTWKGRDTLAFGNITGAMVFQSTFPVSVGLLFTQWRLTGMALFSAVIAMLSALTVLVDLTFRKRLSPVTLLLGGGFYLLYAVVLVVNKI